ncbi:MAG: hypothetical protein Q9220_006085 [cf. Caloplaca sp. 1 TL-2023]
MPFQTGQTDATLPTIKFQRSRSRFTTGIFSNPLKRNPSVAPRGVVGEDQTEIKIREAFLRKRAYERECYANGDDGNYVDDDTVDEEEIGAVEADEAAQGDAGCIGRRDESNEKEKLDNKGFQQRCTSKRSYLAQILQEAQSDQRRTVRNLEQSYHALRTSSRLLDQRYSTYIKSLEEELHARSWRDSQEVSNFASLVQYQEELDIHDEIAIRAQKAAAKHDVNPSYSAETSYRASMAHDRGRTNQPKPMREHQQTHTGEHSANLKVRPSLSDLQQPQGSWMVSPNSNQGHQELFSPIHDAAYQALAPRPPAQASRFTREQLMALGERARQRRHSPEKPAPPAITTTPASPTHPVERFRSTRTSRLNAHATVPAPQRNLSAAVGQQEGSLGIRASHEAPAKILSTTGPSIATAHEVHYYRPGVLGHFGGPETTKIIQVGFAAGNPGSVRRKLHKTPPK